MFYISCFLDIKGVTETKTSRGSATGVVGDNVGGRKQAKAAIVWILCHGNQYHATGVDAKSGETEQSCCCLLTMSWGSLIVVECCSMPISGLAKSLNRSLCCVFWHERKSESSKDETHISCRLQFHRCFFVFTIVVAQTLSSWEGKSTGVGRCTHEKRS